MPELLALPELQQPADPVVAVFREHSQHVAVQVSRRVPLFLGVLEPGNGDAECHHAMAIVGAEGLASDLGDHDEEADGQQVDVVEAQMAFCSSTAPRNPGRAT